MMIINKLPLALSAYADMLEEFDEKDTVSLIYYASGDGVVLKTEGRIETGIPGRLTYPDLPDDLALFAIPGFDSRRYAAWLCGQYKEKPRITLIRD